jgi:hypothetical protein
MHALPDFFSCNGRSPRFFKVIIMVNCPDFLQKWGLKFGGDLLSRECSTIGAGQFG